MAIDNFITVNRMNGIIVKLVEMRQNQMEIMKYHFILIAHVATNSFRECERERELTTGQGRRTHIYFS